MTNSLKPFMTISLLIRAIAASCVLLLTVAATPRLGVDDIPELPMPDGSGDTPEIIIDLLPGGASVEGQKQFKLSSLRGKVALIDMFLSTCPHCEEHAPRIVELYNQYHDRGFTVLGIATDPGGKENKDAVASVKAYTSLAKIEYPVGFLIPEVIAYYADSHDHGVPQMILFGPDGKMVIRRIGWNEKSSKEIQAAIEAQLAKVPTVKPGSKASSRPPTRKSKQG
jgi:glutathione peroxidase-family protein